MGRAKTIDFWRVERPNGQGPYGAPSILPNKGSVSARFVNEVGIWKTGFQPTAKFRYDMATHYFGFTSLKQYDRWFSPDQRKILKQEGFVLRRYVVPRALVKADTAQGVAPVRHDARIAAKAIAKPLVKKIGLKPGGPGRWVTMRGTHVFIEEK